MTTHADLYTKVCLPVGGQKELCEMITIHDMDSILQMVIFLFVVKCSHLISSHLILYPISSLPLSLSLHRHYKHYW